MRDRTRMIGKLCSSTAYTTILLQACLPIAPVFLRIAALCLPTAVTGMSYAEASGAAWFASVCGCYNIAEPVHAASVKLCVTCGHSILC